MVTASLMARMLDGVPDKSPCLGDDAPSWQPPPPPPAAVFSAGQRIRCGQSGIARIVRGRYGWCAFRAGFVRLLAHWPPYLAHVAVEIVPLFRRDDVVEICSQIVTRIDSVVPPLAEGPVGGSAAFRRRDCRRVAWLVAGLSGPDQPSDDCLQCNP